MTQTFAVAATPTLRTVGPYVAQTVGYRDSRFGMKIHFHMQTSVAQARSEFGPTLAEAQSFARDITCIECGRAACEPLECIDCGTQGCACLIFEDEHSGEAFCADHERICLGTCCQD